MIRSPPSVTHSTNVKVNKQHLQWVGGEIWPPMIRHLNLMRLSTLLVPKQMLNNAVTSPSSIALNVLVISTTEHCKVTVVQLLLGDKTNTKISLDLGCNQQPLTQPQKPITDIGAHDKSRRTHKSELRRFPWTATCFHCIISAASNHKQIWMELSQFLKLCITIYVALCITIFF